MTEFFYSLSAVRWPIAFSAACALLNWASMATELDGIAQAADASSKSSEEGDHIWRTGDRDGANCLYFLLRKNGSVASYEDVLNALGARGERKSLHQVCSAAESVGLPCAVYQCRTEDLARLREPVIAYTELGGLGGGTLVVVLGVSEQPSVNVHDEREVFVMLGGTATISSIPLNDFIRCWSGHILKLKEEGIMPPWSWAVLSCAAGFGVQVWRARRAAIS